MKKILLTLFISINSIVYSQNNNLDSLNLKLKSIEDEISTLNSLKEEVKNQINLLTYSNKQSDTLNKNNYGIVAFPSVLGTDFFEKPYTNSNKIFTISYKDSVLVLNRYKKTKWLKTKYKNVYGYVLYNSLRRSEALFSLYDSKKANRLERLIKKFGRKDAMGILNSSYWIGMSKNMAEESLGRPNSKNKSTGSWGLHEQWVYRKGNNKTVYLYFENNTLTSYQNEN